MKKLSLLLILIIMLSCQEEQVPICRILHPSDNAIFSQGESVTISVDADDRDGNIVEVRLLINNSVIAVITASPYDYELNTDEYASGIYTLEAVAEDNSGITTSDEIQFTIEAVSPTVTTADITEITASSAKCGGTVVNDGGESVTAHGVCWSTEPQPTIDDYKTIDGSGIGMFSSSISGLNPYTTYYIRAYATNSVGTEYGEENTFKTKWNSSVTVTDYDGNVYNTVLIGDQIWMAENLKVTRYADGTPVPLVEDSTEWDALGYIDKAYCWYDNSTANKDTYGGLYTWAAVMNGNAGSDASPSGVQGVCPDGWHLPSDGEWKQLEMYLGMSQADADFVSLLERGTDEGGKLKEVGTSHWSSPNTGATNESGFTGLPGGVRYNKYGFVYIGYSGDWWSSSEYDDMFAWFRTLVYNYAYVIRDYEFKDHGFAVRCVKDQP